MRATYARTVMSLTVGLAGLAASAHAQEATFASVLERQLRYAANEFLAAAAAMPEEE